MTSGLCASFLVSLLVAAPLAQSGEACLALAPGAAAPVPSMAVCGFSLIAHESGPQIASLGGSAFAACVREGEKVEIEISAANLTPVGKIRADVALAYGQWAQAGLALDVPPELRPIGAGETVILEAGASSAVPEGRILLTILGGPGESVVRVRNIRLTESQKNLPLPALPAPPAAEAFPPPALPELRPGMETVLIEWDWRMRDGIETEREPVPYVRAIERTLMRGNGLIESLNAANVPLGDVLARWRALEQEFAELSAMAPPGEDPRWETLWLRVHQSRRQLVFSNPLAQTGPLLFAKHAHSAFSHQLTQYYGRLARPGGGLFVLENPGESMRCRALTSGQLPEGSYMQPEVTHDAVRILFAFCATPSVPDWDDLPAYRDRHFHLFEIRPDGSGLRQLTDGPYDDFSPRELPDGKIIFISTRRGGFHRCGRGPCDVYTLALAGADGSNPHPVSYHETQEWDPAVLADGRIIYTRWDYVDRNAVHYQQLWTSRQDGSAPMAFYGNNTFNPVGVWEARQAPGSPLIMATAAAHHAMTAGSIILVDRSKGVEGQEPLRRLTPDAPFPESETIVPPSNWHAPGSPKEYATPEEARRWPGHCYRSPYPLSETLFLAAYSFDPLLGEPVANKANMFGLYLVDALGNCELLYRDLNISSLWPVPLRQRPRPPSLPPVRDDQIASEGLIYMQNVYESNYDLAGGSVKRLRIVQVLPKTTPHANDPTVGLANASPGKQVLGTVPVEADGSAYFYAPARIPLSFQALDEQGRAVQTMRSLTYLQPGEKVSCAGCHEPRLSAPAAARAALAAMRPPSHIEPGPDGSNPFSYPLLVQPVLDQHCVRCHGGETPSGPEGQPLVLTGEPEGRYTKSYNALAPRVPYSSWGELAANGEPETLPGRFGARASRLMAMLLEGHHDVRLNTEEMERLVTWMDANALFYGTFDPEGQARQLRGERIDGPSLN
ncbi:MAG: PD40 domain-containing protein [Candidatus Hydrogenedentes bacterium]|nr:PD40 domain-containing protein [Candidatus Hydrogenedentota bacterium]